MSMLSGLTSNLRVLAKAIDVRVTEHPVVDNQELCRTLRDAADAIDELRGMDYKLRKESDDLKDLVYDMYGYYVAGTLSICEICNLQGDCENHPATSCKYSGDPRDADPYDDFKQRMCKFGIEVEW